METAQLKKMIDLFFDKELEKNKEPLLFSLLSQDEEAREYFKELNLIKTSIEGSREEVPYSLEARILYSIDEKEGRKKKLIIRRLSYSFAYAAALLLLAASIFLYSKVNDYKSEVENIKSQVQYQAQTIELLYNALPPQVVQAKFSNEVIVKARM